MKKAVSFLVVFFMISMIPCTAFASQVYTEGALYYTIDNGSITIVGYFGRDETVEIPNQIAGVPVNTIASGAFTDNPYVKLVILPDTITTIEENAFDPSITVKMKVSSSEETSEEKTEDEGDNGGTQTEDSSAGKGGSEDGNTENNTSGGDTGNTSQDTGAAENTTTDTETTDNKTQDNGTTDNKTQDNGTAGNTSSDSSSQGDDFSGVSTTGKTSGGESADEDDSQYIIISSGTGAVDGFAVDEAEVSIDDILTDEEAPAETTDVTGAEAETKAENQTSEKSNFAVYIISIAAIGVAAAAGIWYRKKHE